MVVTTRGDIPLGTEEKFDVVTIEFSPMGNITLSCENEVPRNLSVRFHRWEGFQWAISEGRECPGHISSRCSAYLIFASRYCLAPFWISFSFSLSLTKMSKSQAKQRPPAFNLEAAPLTSLHTEQASTVSPERMLLPSLATISAKLIVSRWKNVPSIASGSQTLSSAKLKTTIFSPRSLSFSGDGGLVITTSNAHSPSNNTSAT